MSRIQKDKVVMSAISEDGKCLLGNAADVYRTNGTLKKRYHDQLTRLGLMTMKAVVGYSYTLQVYAVEPSYLFKPF